MAAQRSLTARDYYKVNQGNCRITTIEPDLLFATLLTMQTIGN